MSIEAMKQALEALEMYGKRHRATYLLGGAWDEEITLGDKATASLRQAIAEAEQQEPVAWMSSGEARMIHWKSKHPGFGDDWIPLYTTPPKREWQGLTDDELEVLNDCGDTDSYQFAKAIEAKLKEKNT